MNAIKLILFSFLITCTYQGAAQGYVPGTLKIIDKENSSVNKDSLILLEQSIFKLKNTFALDDSGNPKPTAKEKAQLDSLKKKRVHTEWFKVNEVHLYGGGSLLGLVTAETKVEESASPTGSVGINFNTNRINCDLFFSYNSKSEVMITNLGQFGSSLLNPDLGGQSLTFKTLVSLHNKFGVSSSFVIADNVWTLENVVKIDVSPMIIRAGAYLNLFDFSDIENKVKITFDAHYTHRSILGDFSNNEQVIENQIITNRGYNGMDVSINAYLNSVKVYVQFSRNSKGDFLIPGFSGSQVLFGVDVTGNLMKLK